MSKRISGIIERILSVDIVISIICLSVLVILTFVGAIARYFFRSPIVWMEEVQTWMMLWTILTGSSYAFRKGAHVSIDILTENFSPCWQKIIAWFGYLCTMAALAFFFYFSLRLNIQFYKTGKITTTLRIPSWKINCMVSIGSLWMALSASYCFIRSQFSKTPNEEGEEQ